MLREPGTTPARYHIFLLSLWEEGGAFPEEERVWRFSLEQAQTAGRKGFKSLAELTAYLEAWTQAGSRDGQPGPCGPLAG